MKRAITKTSKTVPLDSSNGFGYVSINHEAIIANYPAEPFPELPFVQAITDETLLMSLIPICDWLKSLRTQVTGYFDITDIIFNFDF